jgi:miniconductance mechanosensitive channel
MKIRWLFDIKQMLLNRGVDEHYIGQINIIVGILVILLITVLSDVIARRLILISLKRIIKKTSTTWDDIIYEQKVFNRLSHIAPAIFLYYSLAYVLAEHHRISKLVQASLKIYMIIIALLVIYSFLNALNKIYQSLPVSNNRPIKGYIQLVQIFFTSMGVILILSIILGKSPTVLLTGLGAMAAVLMLIFKDTLLGFVASIQLSANNMIRIGDWITMPQHNADGTVVEITLNTVKIQNSDKTISTIPTYALISDSFWNWRGMQESGGRRIKKYISIDMRSVKFCTTDMIDTFRKITFMKDYLDQQQWKMVQRSSENPAKENFFTEGHSITNLGIFRKYLELYLKNHDMIHPDMPLAVRYLQSTETGIPIEIFAFSKEQEWVSYENIQADIFDHILAILPEFELKVFQNLSGSDLQEQTTNRFLS